VCRFWINTFCGIFAAGLPPHLKRSGKQSKYILKKACEGLLPMKFSTGPNAASRAAGALFSQRT